MAVTSGLFTEFKLAGVQTEQRVVDGHANTWAGPDLNGDVVSVNAFDRWLSSHHPSDVPVFVGHNTASLPVGTPLTIRPDAKGLFTSTYIFPTSAGNDLLATAKALAKIGQPLGMSIGFRTVDAEPERGPDGQLYRKLTDVDLMEYSFAAKQVIANPTSVVTDVKHASASATPRHVGTLKGVVARAYRADRLDDVHDLRSVLKAMGYGIPDDDDDDEWQQWLQGLAGVPRKADDDDDDAPDSFRPNFRDHSRPRKTSSWSRQVAHFYERDPLRWWKRELGW